MKKLKVKAELVKSGSQIEEIKNIGKKLKMLLPTIF